MHRDFIKVSALLLSMGAAGLCYVTFAEPNMLYRRRFTVKCPYAKLDRPIKAVHFTDVHLGKFISLRKLESLTEKINAENPDMVFFTGDLIDNPTEKYFSPEEIGMVLKKIKAPMGKFAVAGNHEHRYDMIEEYEKALNLGGFEFLSNESVYISILNINIVGCESSTVESRKNADRVKPKNPITLDNIRKSSKLLRSDSFNILLTHHPDVVDETDMGENLLALAGHSHGYQIRMPVFEKWYAPALAKKYPRGLYVTEKGAEIHTSEGIGMTRFPFRFCCPPNIGVITFES